METLSVRQSEILRWAMKEGRVEVDSLADSFAVSPQTIRKDLNDLCDRNLLQRVRGGAVAGSSNQNYSYEARFLMGTEAKEAIGRTVARLIPNSTSLLLNLGTTVEKVAYALQEHSGLLVITNNTHVVNIMKDCRGIQLVIAGGEVRQSDGGVVGVAAKEFIEQFKVEYAVIGTSGIDRDGTLLDYDFKEVAVAQTIIANARKVILATDISKLDRVAPVRIGTLAQVDTVVIDKPLPEELQIFCAEHGTEVVLADRGSSLTGA